MNVAAATTAYAISGARKSAIAPAPDESIENSKMKLSRAVTRPGQNAKPAIAATTSRPSEPMNSRMASDYDEAGSGTKIGRVKRGPRPPMMLAAALVPDANAPQIGTNR